MVPPTPLPDSNWSKRTHAIPFRQMIHLNPHTTSPNTFTSISAAYPPSSTTRTYGGHVIAQAAYAACHTLPVGFHVHSITGYFLSIGETQYPFRYIVRRIRDGGVYSVRFVDVFQDLPTSKEGIATEPMFVAIVGLKRDENHYHKAGHKKQRRDFGHQGLPKDWLEKEYGNVLGKRRFEDFTVCQGMDALWTSTMNLQAWKKRGDVFPGLQMRKVDLSSRNGSANEGAFADDGETARKWRCLHVYRYIDGEERDSRTSAKAPSSQKKMAKTAADDELNLFACAHIYASDRNGLFMTQRAIGMEKYSGNMGSLSHTMNFHVTADMLRMVGDNGQMKEFVQESWAGSSGDDRVSHESRIWDRETGVIIASTLQDGMMRIPVAQDVQINDGEIILRREAKL